jgi:hypothetical protein
MIDFNKYDKNYVILNSDRLIFNSKVDSIFLSSNKTIGLSAVEQLHFNVGPLGNRDPEKHYIIFNSPLIQLGLSKDGINEPVAKATSTIDCFNEITSALSAFSIALTTATAVGVGTASLPAINTAANLLNQELKRIHDKYGISKTSPIVSKITKTI